MLCERMLPTRRDFIFDAAVGASVWLSQDTGLGRLVAQSPATQVFYDPTTLKHEPGTNHPERPQRMTAVLESVRALEGLGRVSVATPSTPNQDSSAGRVEGGARGPRRRSTLRRSPLRSSVPMSRSDPFIPAPVAVYAASRPKYGV